MVRSLRGLGSIGTVREIPSLEDAVRRQRPPGERKIEARATPPGEREDPLEAQALQGVSGTLPERIVWRWLEYESGWLYNVEYSYAGGRRVAGGMVLDFYVYSLFPRVVIRVQGEYWHHVRSGQRVKDDRAAQQLLQAGYRVIDLWELEIYAAALSSTVGPYITREIMA